MKNDIRSNRGQILLEALVTHFLQIAFVALLLLAVFGVFATALVHADAYSLARSSLYGTPRACRPVQDWPKFSGLEIRYQCPHRAIVIAQIKLNTLLDFKHEIKVSLRNFHE